MLTKPAVDGFERAHAGDVRVIRMDIRSDVGNYLAYVFNVRAVPAFLIFGADGQPAGRHVGIASQTTLNELLDNVAKER